uniref:Neurotransmitter-gated ion-channel transmembrane domain-containing protein n=1 Tax=Plectus sambesii TaxID=2011161 RepID=A0A914UY08_9BILA
MALFSDGYTTGDIDYHWGKNRQSDQTEAVKFSPQNLPQFKVEGYLVNDTKASTSSGDYVRLYFEVLLVRSIGFYMMNIFVPSILIVIISWVSFWLNREASPARVALGVTTVLTMTTLTTTTNSTMPKVSYVKAIDYFLGFCFVMVFASLLEYAAVTYLNKKLAQRREKRRKKAEEEQSKPVEYPMFSSSSKPTPVHTAINSPLILPERSGAMVPIMGRYSPVRVMRVPGSPCT